MNLKNNSEAVPPISVAIASNAETSRADLFRQLESEPNIQVIWETRNGSDAVRLCAQETPDLILMDLVMPGKNGAEATLEIMAATPCAILVMTAGIEKNAPLIFEALAAGALDVVEFQTNPVEQSQCRLREKIRIIARRIARKPKLYRSTSRPDRKLLLIAIGASAGGPAALRLILEQFPSELPAAVVIIQHLNERYADGMAAWLSTVSRRPIRVAKQGERPDAGSVLLAGTDDHLVLQADGTLTYTEVPLDQPYRPSVDEFFISATRHWSGPIVGVVLTGMGQDGARGLLEIKQLGHITLAQDEQSSIVYGMPGAAVRLGAVMAQLPPDEIGKELVKIVFSVKPSLQTNRKGKHGQLERTPREYK